MNTLWVYGCSFSEPFGLLPIENSIIVSEDGARTFYGVDYWGTHLAKKLNLNIITKSLSGMGWNYINHWIELDTLKWNKNDIIIISPSFFSRVNVMEFEKVGTLSIEHNHLLKSTYDIILYNELRWKTKIEILQNFGYNIYTWLVDGGISDKNDVKNLIKTPEGSYNFKDWMDLHKEYWIDTTTNIYPNGDWHFNEMGHIALSEIMYDYINNSK
jgi:hypothetical protein